jgi:hypothetical protein
MVLGHLGTPSFLRNRKRLAAQLLINAVTGQVESWYGTCPVTRLIGSWGGHGLGTVRCVGKLHDAIGHVSTFRFGVDSRDDPLGTCNICIVD